MSISKEHVQNILNLINDRYEDCDKSILRNRGEMKFLNRYTDNADYAELQGETSMIANEKIFLHKISVALNEIIMADKE